MTAPDYDAEAARLWLGTDLTGPVPAWKTMRAAIAAALRLAHAAGRAERQRADAEIVRTAANADVAYACCIDLTHAIKEQIEATP